MTRLAFNRLKVGDTVTLASDCRDYFHGHPTWDGDAFIPAGTTGTVGAVRVPAVTGKERCFVCVDFPAGTSLFRGKMTFTATHSARCGAFVEDLK